MIVKAETSGAMSAAIEVFVSPDGNDTWDGSCRWGQGGKGPYATLERAREVIRERRQAAGGVTSPATLWLQGGDYLLSDSFVLEAMDGGTPEAPLLMAACKGEKVRLLGGRKLSGFSPVSDPAVLERLDAGARGHVLQIDLRACGITDFGCLKSRGFNRKVVPAPLELIIGGAPQQLARWPNDRFATIESVGSTETVKDEHGGSIGRFEDGFHYRADENRPERWKSYESAWIHGYWSWDWANSYEAIDTIDLQARLIRMKPPYGNYSYRAGQRIQYFNLLEELDAPGEYYVDGTSGRLYFWPLNPLDGAEVLVSMLEKPLVEVRGASHVTLRGLTLEAGRGCGVTIQGGESVTVDGCRVANMGNHGVVIDGGRKHAVSGCTISNCGDSGIEVSGGDRPTLTPAGHEIVGNHVHHFARWSKCYVPGVQARGVGIRIANNLIHDAPHSAIIYWGNEILIERNRIHHVCTETDDCGAIYTGRDFTARGNVIRHNWISDVRGNKHWAIGIYMDDNVSGQTIEGNIIEHARMAMLLGGGRDLIVRNNLLLDCDQGIAIDGRGLNKAKVWHDMIYVTMRDRYLAMHPDQPPFSERYPELREVEPFFAADDGVPPKIRLERNIALNGPLANLHWGAESAHVTFDRNLAGSDPGFVDVARWDLGVPADTPAAQIGFEPIPVHTIGLPQPDRGGTARSGSRNTV